MPKTHENFSLPGGKKSSYKANLNIKRFAETQEYRAGWTMAFRSLKLWVCLWVSSKTLELMKLKNWNRDITRIWYDLRLSILQNVIFYHFENLDSYCVSFFCFFQIMIHSSTCKPKIAHVLYITLKKDDPFTHLFTFNLFNDCELCIICVL